MPVIAGRLVALLVVLLMAGCASTMPPHAGQAPSHALVAPAGAPLTDVGVQLGLDAGATAAWPLPEAAFALDARLASIEHATTSVDLQTYLVADDRTGHQVLRALRDAANRGVRVRLLVDDIYTAGLDPLLVGLASHANVEVRLFNPFVAGRASTTQRLFALLWDLHRLDHRMHNKLFVADGALAIVGGRNVADEYFLRSRIGNFFDLDLLIVGALVPELSASFDRYWNSEQAYDVHSIVAATRTVEAAPAELRAEFERRTSSDTPADPAPPADLFGAVAFSRQLESGRFRFIRVLAASTLADPPEKASPDAKPAELATLWTRYLARISEARSEAILFSPYFVPNEEAMQHLRELRAREVSVRVTTNSLAVSDEPLTTIALERHQRELLTIGVDLYELSSQQLHLDTRLRTLLGSSIGRLHAKLGIIDRRFVYVGSLNLDGRSAAINTEIGVRVDSAEIAAMILHAFRVEQAIGVVRVRLASDGRLAWSVLDAEGHEQTLEREPEGSWWRRLRLRLLALFVPEHEL